MRELKRAGRRLLFSACFAAIAGVGANAETTTFGPVRLTEGQRLEVCANSLRAEFPVIAVVTFHRVNDGSTLEGGQKTLAPGEGGCAAIGFDQVGSAPIFGALGTTGEPGDRDLVGNGFVTNGIFVTSLAPLQLASDLGIDVGTTFGPVRLKPGTRFEVCANALQNETPVETSVAFYSGRNSDEPFLVRGGSLAPGRGACVSVDYDAVRGRPIFAELRTQPVAEGVASPTVVGGAAVINGIYVPVPGKRRLPSIVPWPTL